MPKHNNTHDKHSQKEVLRSLGSGSHIIRDALRGQRGTPGQTHSTAPRTPTSAPRTTNSTTAMSQPLSSSRLHRQPTRHTTTTTAPTTAPIASRQRPEGVLRVEERRRSGRWPKQAADDFIKQGGSKGFSCTVCSKSYVSMQYAREHVKNRHQTLLPDRAGPSSRRERPVFKCTKCDYVGLSQHGLRIHMGSKHKH